MSRALKNTWKSLVKELKTSYDGGAIPIELEKAD